MANILPSPDQIFKLSQTQGLLATAIIFAMYIIAQFVVARINEKRAKEPAPVVPDNVDLETLLSHRLFDHCQYYVSFGVRKLNFSPDYPIRAKMYKAMLEMYFDIISTKLHANIARLSTAHTKEWTKETMKVMREIQDEYEQAFIDNGVPEIVVGKFADWHAPTTEFVINTVNSLNDSRMARSSNQKTSVLLGTIENSTKAAIFNAERTLIELNGNLSGQMYQGEVIE